MCIQEGERGIKIPTIELCTKRNKKIEQIATKKEQKEEEQEAQQKEKKPKAKLQVSRFANNNQQNNAKHLPQPEK